MQVDLSQRLTFPPEIVPTNLCPDLALWSKSCRSIFVVEATVPWKDGLDEAFELKWLQYAIAAEVEGWDWEVGKWQVGCRGFVASST